MINRKLILFMLDFIRKIQKWNMREWWIITVIVIMLILLARPVQAAWLKNLAVLRLQPAWSLHNTPILDPPCDTHLKFPVETKYLQSSAAIMDPNPSALTQLGRVLWMEGECTGAVSLWEQASKYNYSPAQYELIRVGKFETFSEELRKKYADLAYWQGWELGKNPQNAAAFEWFTRSFDLDPQHRTIKALIELHRRNGETLDASSMWQQLKDAYPDTDAEHWYAAGSLYNLDANWQSAAAAFTEAARLTSDDSHESWLDAGFAWMNDLNWGQAEASFERAQQVNPKSIECYLALGTLYRVQRKYQEAIDWYSKTRELFPETAAPYIHLGETFVLMGDYVQARQNLMNALKIEPTNQSGMYLLAQIYYHEGNPQLAETWLLEAINHEIDPQNLGAWWMQLGDWRLEWNNCSGALEAYTNASTEGVNEEMMQKLKKLEELCKP